MINFPSNPTTGDVYSFQGRIWRWNGTSWRTIASSFSGNVIIIGGSGGNVVSVNGQTGNVNLSTREVFEFGNLYFTNARATAAFSSGTGINYSKSTGIIAIGQNVDTTSNVTFQNLLVTGNLSVLGNAVTISAATLSVADNMIYLNANSEINNPDLGFAGNYNDGSYKHAGLFRDATDGVWKFFDSYTLEPDASPNININHGSFRLSNLQVTNITGNLTGTVTSLSNHNTSNLVEGANLYYTNARVYSNILQLSYANTNTTNTISNNLAIAWNTANSAFNKANIVPTQLINGGDILSLDGSNKVNLPGNTSFIFSATNNITLSPDASGDNSFEIINNVGATLKTDNAFDIRTNTGGTEKVWTFTQGGSLFFPDSTFQTTAFSNTYLSTRLATKANVSDLTTANVSELTNLYYTNARVYDNVITLGYSTNAYVNTRLLTKANVADLTTENVAEVTNLYFTNTRAVSALTGGTGIIIDSNGRITSSVTGGGGTASVTASNTAPSSPSQGALWLETDNGDVYIYYSNSWVAINVPNYIEPVLSIDQFSGNDSTLTYNLSATPANLYYTTVFVDGVYQSKLTYSITGNSIVFTEAPPTGTNNIEISTYSIRYLPVTKEYKYNKYTANGVGKVYGLQSFGHTNTSILVFENGICQMPEDDYYVSSNAVIFATAPAANVVIQIREMPLT